MSATGRGAERIASDNYPTPAWCVRRMLEAAPWGPLRILEPCAGEGAIVKVLRESYPRASIVATELRKGADIARKLSDAGADVFGTGSDAASIGMCWNAPCDLEITNPPFSCWHAIAHASLTHRRPTWLALLLRLGAVAHLTQELPGGKRTTLPTPSLYVLPQRPAFVASSKCKARSCGEKDGVHYYDTLGCGWREMAPIDAPPFAECPQCGGKVQRSTSDASEYAWFVWGPQAPRVVVLADTPLEERRS